MHFITDNILSKEPHFPRKNNSIWNRNRLVRTHSEFTSKVNGVSSSISVSNSVIRSIWGEIYSKNSEIWQFNLILNAISHNIYYPLCPSPWLVDDKFPVANLRSNFEQCDDMGKFMHNNIVLVRNVLLNESYASEACDEIHSNTSWLVYPPQIFTEYVRNVFIELLPKK